LQTFQQLLEDPKGKFGNVLNSAMREQLEAVLNQLSARSQAVAQTAQPVAAGALGMAAPAGVQGSALSQNLLSMPVPQAVTDPAWGAALGERLIWMAKGDHQMAELKISPPNLGPLEVKLNINHDQASVSFVSHHAAVRDAIESAIPRLREMLAEQSINLVQADVGSGRQHDPGSAGGDGQGLAGFLSDADQDPALAGGSPEDASTAGMQRGLGLLDLFA
jgi:flagellar hook-length control protein FliK